MHIYGIPNGLNIKSCTLYNDVQMDQQTPIYKEYKNFELYAITTEIIMTEYHHSINRQTDGLF